MNQSFNAFTKQCDILSSDVDYSTIVEDFGAKGEGESVLGCV